MRRIRVTATIDRDAASPDSIRAANEYLTSQIEQRANALLFGVDWNKWRCVTRQNRHGDLVLVQWARVLKP